MAPKQSSLSNNGLKTFMQKYDLIDIWREIYPTQIAYTWSNKSGMRQSRIDFWLVPGSFLKDNVSVNILATPLTTDHKAIYINIRLSAVVPPFCNFFWKMNISHLKHEVVKSELSKIIFLHWDLAQKEGSFGRYWELMK